MKEEQEGFWGCLSLVFVAVLVGVGTRADNITQFLIMGALAIGGLVLTLAGVALVVSKETGCEGTGYGVAAGLAGVAMAIVVGHFLVTGDYDQTMKWAQKTYFEQKGQKAEKSDVTPSATATAQVAPTEAAASPTPRAAAAIEETTNIDNPDSTGLDTAAPLPNETETGAWRWFLDSELTVDQITKALNTIQQAPDEDIDEIVEQLKAVTQLTSGERHRAALLLLANALEQRGDPGPALATYKMIGTESAEDPLGVSAAFRVGQLENPRELEKYYREQTNQANQTGWFIIADKWEMSSTWHAAVQGMIEVHKTDLSVRFFNALRDLSPFADSYHYLFILLVMTFGYRLLAFPLDIRWARYWRLAPQIQLLQRVYGNDSATLNQRTAELYRENGVRAWDQWAIIIVDLIFVFWAANAMGNYALQMQMDGAKFLWVSDVTQADRIIALLCGISLLFMTWSSISGSKILQVALVLYTALIALSNLVAYWGIFLMLVWLVSQIIRRILLVVI